MVCKASSSSPEPQTWGEGGGSAGLCELRVRVNYILQWGPLLPSRKAGKRLGRPVRLPHSAEGCLDPGGCLHGARNPESHTWVLLPLRYQPGGHAGDTLALLQVISRKGRSRSQDKTSALQPPPHPRNRCGMGFKCVIHLSGREPSGYLTDAGRGE